MQKLAVLVVLLGLVCVGLCVDPPAATSTVGYPVNVTLQYSAVIGQNNTASTGTSYIGANTFYDVESLTWFAQSNYSSRLGGPGLFAADSGYDRGLFFNANNLNAPTSYNYAFAVPNSTEEGYYDMQRLDYTANGVYALVYQSIIYFWNYSTINAVGAGNAFPQPDATFGNTTVSTGLNPYYYIYNAYDMITKKSTGEIFVADSSCSRILVFPPTASTASPAPSYAIGQNDTYQCSYYSCTTYSPTTCVYAPKYIAFDCYEGLWTYDSYYGTFYYFPNNSRIATFQFNGTSAVYGHFTGAHGLTVGPGCNYLTFLGDEEAVFIFSVTYGSIGGFTTPVSVSSVLTFGNAYNYNSNNNDYTNTGTLNDVHGAAYNNQTLYLSDYSYSRIVALNFSALISNSNQPSFAAPSTGASSSSVAGNTATATSTATAAALSSGASSYPSSTNTASPVYSTEGNSESNSPIYFFTGATSQLSSWVDLFEF